MDRFNLTKSAGEDIGDHSANVLDSVAEIRPEEHQFRNSRIFSEKTQLAPFLGQ